MNAMPSKLLDSSGYYVIYTLVCVDGRAEGLYTYVWYADGAWQTFESRRRLEVA